ncbi:MAG: heme ABC exporter ATP-binding protein CcmA [Chromatiales bacterium]|nr:heme ABC exporter ATP-binding protein CcmA [Chromatiales bacterium]
MLWRGDHCLFADLGFSVTPGNVLLVTGANGSGKTTLLRVIVGFIEPECGQVSWDGGPPPSALPDGRPLFAWLGHLPGVKRELTVLQNLRFFAAMLDGAHDGLEPLAARLGLGERLDVEVRQLSAGQQRRLAMARLHLARAPVWVLDEPFTNLDAAGRELLEALVADHIGGGGIAVIAAHLELGARLRPRVELRLGAFS